MENRGENLSMQNITTEEKFIKSNFFPQQFFFIFWKMYENFPVRKGKSNLQKNANFFQKLCFLDLFSLQKQFTLSLFVGTKNYYLFLFISPTIYFSLFFHIFSTFNNIYFFTFHIIYFSTFDSFLFTQK